MKNFPYKKYLPLTVMLSLFSGMGLILWLGIVPVRGFITEKADAIQQFYTLRENHERQVSKLPELRAQFESIVPDENTLHVLLTEDHIVDFVKILEGLAQDLKVEIVIKAKDGTVIQEKNITKQAPKKVVASGDDSTGKAKGVASIVDTLPYDRYLRLDIIVRGEYVRIVSFLHKMETLPYALDVVGVSMRDRGESDTQPIVVGVGRNPFLLTPGNVPVSVDGSSAQLGETSQGTPVSGNLEASFDTAVYLDKN